MLNKIPSNILNEKDIKNNAITNLSININIQQIEIKDNLNMDKDVNMNMNRNMNMNLNYNINTNMDMKMDMYQNKNKEELNPVNYIEDIQDEKRGDINILKNTQIKNLDNYNYNYNLYDIKDIRQLNEVSSKQNNLSEKNTMKPSPSKNWRKLSNIFRSVNSLKKLGTKSLINNKEIDNDLDDFREKLNTLKKNKSRTNSENFEPEPVRNLSLEQREIYRISIKERLFAAING
jgi:hypothetical protein